MELDPDNVVSPFKMGALMMRTARAEEALVFFRMSSELRPDAPVVHNNVGLTCTKLQMFEEATAAFERGLEASKDAQAKGMILNNMGIMYKEMGETEKAMECFEQALRLPSVEAYINKASSLIDAGEYEEAEKCMREGLRVKPESLSDAYNGLGASIEMTHSRLNQSVVFFEEAVKANPRNEPAYFSWVHLRCRLCDWREHERLFEEVRKMIDRGATGGLGPIFGLAYPLSDEQMCTVARARAREAVGNVKRMRNEFVPWAPNFAAIPEKLGIAIVSADFNMKPVGQLIQSVFKMMDKDKFEIFAFMLEAHDNSHVMANIANSVDEWNWCKGLSPLVVAQMVNNEQPNILIDFSGFTDGARNEIGALKPAPVAVNYLGFPYTLTMEGFDYILSDRVVLPPEQHTSCFPEKVAWLPNMYMVNDHKQSQAEQILGDFTAANASNLSLPHRSQQLVLANFNHLQKLGPHTFHLWLRIMQELPDSVLWLLRFPPEAEPNLRREFEEREIGTRLHLSDKFPSKIHLNVKRAASLLLDTLEYNAHVSGLDALWAGLPLVTLAGSNMARRCGASFLRTMKVPQLLARTSEEYVSIATQLGENPRKLQELRDKVLNDDRLPPAYSPAGRIQQVERHSLRYEGTSLVHLPLFLLCSSPSTPVAPPPSAQAPFLLVHLFKLLTFSSRAGSRSSSRCCGSCGRLCSLPPPSSLTPTRSLQLPKARRPCI
ncbi:hypothetical protein GUITHDRAFT_75246 [Guillardia theta CCMP2712]|uniref:protein O-GlcNAc transferase n=1 Tax=Guillardia theta (strain CCMP2712) TaxID=905079 RepID=L1IX40_GUITC|nr:hypothetical protein GUITHDRAFT_75246 [Guillardia theta CCMP2712]EKX40776.1 hypothetical protein GUITHDRAFT_75246 [Guillardia theta CCMP2712]|eukprot:XP_005827756.1 hypothetical protein GUITHDRAFT_75246 [Guillardia theta CCMP2712]